MQPETYLCGDDCNNIKGSPFSFEFGLEIFLIAKIELPFHVAPML